jgi:hypothetical protein
MWALSAARPVYVVLAVAAALALCSCYADLDWRELRPAEAGFVAMLPGRITEESRPLAAFPQASLHQWSARAKQSLFSVGYADVGSAPAVNIFRDALLANINGAIESERDLSIPGARGRETRATGTATGAPVVLRLRLYQRNTRVYQMAVISRPGDLSEDDFETYFTSFRLRD